MTSTWPHFTMIKYGGFVSAASPFFLAASTSTWAAVLFVVTLSLGEAVWSPRLYDYTMSIAPEVRSPSPPCPSLPDVPPSPSPSLSLPSVCCGRRARRPPSPPWPRPPCSWPRCPSVCSAAICCPHICPTGRTDKATAGTATDRPCGSSSACSQCACYIPYCMSACPHRCL